MKDKVEIMLDVGQDGELTINATGSTDEIWASLSLAVIDIALRNYKKNGKWLRKKLCALVMGIHLNECHTSDELAVSIEESLNRWRAAHE